MGRDRRYPATCPTCGRDFMAVRGRVFCQRACTRHSTPEQRFWAGVDASSGAFACWPWIASRTKAGYGQITVDGVPTYTHRYALELALGRPIAPGMEACHGCDNPPCANPGHLFEGSRKDNHADMVAKGRARGPHLVGELSPSARLSADEVRAMRALYRQGGVTQKSLADTFHVGTSTVHSIVHGRTWQEGAAA